MSRAMKISLVLALLGVAAGAIYLRGLQEQVLRLGRPQQSEEQVRREITQPVIPAPASNKQKAKFFWAAEGGVTLEPVDVEMALSGDASQRAKQLMLMLIAAPPKPAQRTLPADATLLELYVLEDGTAIADFSDAVARATPSGILSEQLALESILRTLQANVPEILRVRILINGQEADTLAGHVDLTGYFELRAAAGTKPALTQPEPPGKLERHQ